MAKPIIPEVTLTKLSAFVAQRQNVNRHTKRGLGMLDHAMSQDGYVAPMTATADGEIIDGSARLEKAAERYPDEALVIAHDGSRPIVMVRTDIPNAADPRAQRIGLAANRISAVNLDFDPAVLAHLSTTLDLSAMWTAEELQSALKGEKKKLAYLTDDDAPPVPSPKPAAEQDRIPLSVVFNTYEARRWREYKESIGTTDDKKALFALLEATC